MLLSYVLQPRSCTATMWHQMQQRFCTTTSRLLAESPCIKIHETIMGRQPICCPCAIWLQAHNDRGSFQVVILSRKCKHNVKLLLTILLATCTLFNSAQGDKVAHSAMVCRSNVSLAWYLLLTCATIKAVVGVALSAGAQTVMVAGESKT